MSDTPRCRDCGQLHTVGIEGIRCDYERGIERPTLGLTRDVQERILSARTGGERYLAGRLTDPEYRSFYDATKDGER